MHGRAAFCSLLLLALVAAEGAAQPRIPPTKPYSEVAQRLEKLIEKELADKGIPAISIALVDDQQIVWARGFGFANAKTKAPATAETVYRVGSVLKLFTDLAVMQLVERGELDLDAPITRILPEFKPRNPFAKPLTLRQLMAHRAGLVREPPLGHYFDPTNPSLKNTVESLNRTELVFEPEKRIKYSNAGIAVVGYALESSQKQPFARYVQKAVLDPLGMTRSGFELKTKLEKDAATALMWTYHGRTFEAPTFPLGMAPAGSLYSTAIDLGRFLHVLCAGGGQVVKRTSLEEMWRPQFSPDGARSGIGLGFLIGELDGRRRIGHNGAMYGFATELALLPDEKLGVIVAASKDCANAVAQNIADVALRHMVAVRQGKPLPAMAEPTPLPAESVKKLAGRYQLEGRFFDLVESAGKLYFWPGRGGFRAEIRALGDALVMDDTLEKGIQLSPADGHILIGKNKFERVPPPLPTPAPERWLGLIGEYGWDHNTLFILEKDGKLHALIEWFFLYPLEEVSENVFKFPGHGLYQDEKLLFTRDATGRAKQVEAASVVFQRRPIAGENGEVFRIRAVRPLEELRKLALAAQPPDEGISFAKPDLVELDKLDATIKLDIRYAGTDNFLSTPFYTSARAFLQRPAAEAVVRAHRKLASQGYGLLIHDGYRPWYVTKMFWDATPEKNHLFVADPSRGSRHNRGCAVDLTLYNLKTGKAVAMVGGYDEFSDRSYPDYAGGTSQQRQHRDLLRRAMEDEGFTVYEAEWWHFDYKDWKKYPILNQTFEQLLGERAK